MKSYILTFIVSLFGVTATVGQVHTTGIKALDLSAGKSGIGFVGHIGYNKNITDNLYFKIGTLAEFGRLFNLKYNSFGADLMMHWNPFYINDFVQLNPGAGITGCYDNLSGVTKGGSKNGFTFGVKGSLDVEVFISDQMAFLLYGNQSFMLKEEFGRYRYDLGVGVRIFLNNNFY